MKVTSVPSVTGPPYTLAWIASPPGPEAVDELVARGVDAVEVLRESETEDENFDWLVRLRGLRSLSVDRERLLKPLPDAALGGLEALTLTARYMRPRLSTAALGELRVLEVSPNVLVGPLSTIPRLEHLTFRTFPAEGFEALSGCLALRRASLRGRRSKACLEWAEPPRALEELQLVGVIPVGLGPLCALPRLVRVMISAGSRKVPGSTLDLAPLAGCSQLEVAMFDGFEEYENAEVLQSLPRLVSGGTY